jgi:two-component system chemotaxis sensor kinase CheA
MAPAATAPSGDEPAIRLNLKDDADLLRNSTESQELLQNIEQGVLVLEERPTDTNTINSIFRAFHTSRAGFLHLDALLRDLAHSLESAPRRRPALRTELKIHKGIIDLILAGADTLKQYTAEIGLQIQGTNAGAPIVVPTQQLTQRLKAALRGETLPSPAAVATPPPAAPAIAPACDSGPHPHSDTCGPGHTRNDRSAGRQPPGPPRDPRPQSGRRPQRPPRTILTEPRTKNHVSPIQR